MTDTRENIMVIAHKMADLIAGYDEEEIAAMFVLMQVCPQTREDLNGIELYQALMKGAKAISAIGTEWTENDGSSEPADD